MKNYPTAFKPEAPQSKAKKCKHLPPNPHVGAFKSLGDRME